MVAHETDERRDTRRASRRQVTILIADDDPDDRMLIIRALRKSRVNNRLMEVADGEELLDYLHRRGRFEDPEDSPYPGLILLDLNMPRMDGREALREIKSDARLRRIPVVVLTTSEAQEDVLRSYDLGVNAFITKPVSFQGLVHALEATGRFWLNIVRHPPEH